MTLHMKRLDNDTVVNVAQLLKEPVGAFRIVDIHLDRFRLDDEVDARDLDGQVRMTRLSTGILVDGRIDGIAEIECARCLELYDAKFADEFDAEFRPSVDVRTGVALPLPPDDEIFVIDNNHELDLTELLRQVAILGLPMRPVCGPDCPGIESDSIDEGDPGDERLAVLQKLLDQA